MIADGEDLDHLEAAYEALAARKTIRVEFENNNTIILSMGNKEDKAKRDMLTHKENEVQDNIKVIMENRNQVKAIGYNGFGNDTMDKYQQEANDHLAKNGGTIADGVTGIEHHTTSTTNGEMEIYIITVTTSRDRDLILGHIRGTVRLKYTEATARVSSLKFGRQGLLHVGQLDHEGKRISFRTKGNNTGLNTNPNYMKVWAEAANELKEQGKSAILDGFWPQIDSQVAINKHSPSKKKNGKKKAQEELIEVEEEETWKIKTPVKSSDEQEKRLATTEKAQAEQSALATTLTDALDKTRVDCNKVLIKADIAIADSSRAANALMKQLAALDEEIEAYVKIVANSGSAAKYLEAQVKKIADYIAKLTNVSSNEMEAMAGPGKKPVQVFAT